MFTLAVPLQVPKHVASEKLILEIGPFVVVKVKVPVTWQPKTSFTATLYVPALRFENVPKEENEAPPLIE
jgi:hypothetical protein